MFQPNSRRHACNTHAHCPQEGRVVVQGLEQKPQHDRRQNQSGFCRILNPATTKYSFQEMSLSRHFHKHGCLPVRRQLMTSSDQSRSNSPTSRLDLSDSASGKGSSPVSGPLHPFFMMLSIHQKVNTDNKLAVSRGLWAAILFAWWRPPKRERFC